MSEIKIVGKKSEIEKLSKEKLDFLKGLTKETLRKEIKKYIKRENIKNAWYADEIILKNGDFIVEITVQDDDFKEQRLVLGV